MSNKGISEVNSYGLLRAEKDMTGAMNRLISIVRQGMESFWTIHWFLRLGMLIFTISAALDLSYHIGASFWPGNLDAILGPDGYYTHLALFVGMVLIVIGVILTRPQPSRQTIAELTEKTIERR